MPEINVVAQNVHIHELPHVFLLLIATETLVLELLSDLSHLFLNELELSFLVGAVSNVSDEQRQTSHDA